MPIRSDVGWQDSGTLTPRLPTGHCRPSPQGLSEPFRYQQFQEVVGVERDVVVFVVPEADGVVASSVTGYESPHVAAADRCHGDEVVDCPVTGVVGQQITAVPPVGRVVLRRRRCPPRMTLESRTP